MQNKKENSVVYVHEIPNTKFEKYKYNTSNSDLKEKKKIIQSLVDKCYGSKMQGDIDKTILNRISEKNKKSLLEMLPHALAREEKKIYYCIPRDMYNNTQSPKDIAFYLTDVIEQLSTDPSGQTFLITLIYEN